MSESIWLLDVEALDENDVPVTLRFSNGEWQGTEYYEPRLKQPGLFTEGLFSGNILPSSRSSFGVTQIINHDGELNKLVDYAVDGRKAKLDFFDGNSRKNAFIGSVERIAFSRNIVEIILRSPSAPLEVRRNFNSYLGDNIPPNGLEGSGDDIKGTPKPRLYGEVRNYSPVLVNEQKLIYQVSDEDCIIEDVYDEGFKLTKGSNYISAEQLEDVAPSAGHWRSFQGYFRLGSPIEGELTVDAKTNDNRLGEVFEKIVNEAGYVLTECKDELNTFGDVRMIATAEETYLEMLDELAQSVGAYWRVTPEGEVEVGVISPPDVEHDARIEPFNILNVSRSSAGVGENGAPIWEVKVEADKIEEVQTSAVGAVAELRLARLSRQYRTTSSQEESVKQRHPLSETKEIQSLLSSMNNAEDVANNILQLVSVRRDDVTVEVAIDSDVLDVPLLSTIKLTTDRLGYDEGRNMLVIGKTYNPVKGIITFNLWG